MRLLIVALIAIPFGTAAAEPPLRAGPPASPVQFAQLDPQKQCPKPAIHKDGPLPRAEMKKLNELPPAQAFHAVYRLDGDGCLDPVMVGYQFNRGR